jgi:hypothetical protein
MANEYLDQCVFCGAKPTTQIGTTGLCSSCKDQLINVIRESIKNQAGSKIVLAECQHGGYGNTPNCIACGGSGWVKVQVFADGEPKPCQHGGYGNTPNCKACKGSGWVGLVD